MQGSSFELGARGSSLIVSVLQTYMQFLTVWAGVIWNLVSAWSPTILCVSFGILKEGLFNIGYPSETQLNLKSSEFSFALNIHFSCPIVGNGEICYGELRLHYIWVKYAFRTDIPYGTRPLLSKDIENRKVLQIVTLKYFDTEDEPIWWFIFSLGFKWPLNCKLDIVGKIFSFSVLGSFMSKIFILQLVRWHLGR